MIKNISIAFLIINLIGAFSPVPDSLPYSSPYFQAAPQVFSKNLSSFDSETLVIQEHIAVDDEYTTNLNETLVVDPPGVMENDVFDLIDADIIFPVLVNSTSNGDVSLSEDGSFVYIPNTDFIGIDSFTYHLDILGELSNEAVVEITVQDMELPQVEWVSPVANGEVYPVNVDEWVELEAAATDNGALTEVQFYRWDAVLNLYMDIEAAEAAPYRVELFTGDLNREWNQVFVRAIDTAGNMSDRAGIWLYLIPPTYTYYFPVIFQ